jgi:hypothetical protein
VVTPLPFYGLRLCEHLARGLARLAQGALPFYKKSGRSARAIAGWADRDLVAGLVQEIDADAAAERKRTGREPLGVTAILRQHPHTCPNKSKKSPTPRFHAASKAAREILRNAYGLFLAAFREAAERLKAGDRTARLPNGCRR